MGYVLLPAGRWGRALTSKTAETRKQTMVEALAVFVFEGRTLAYSIADATFRIPSTIIEQSCSVICGGMSRWIVRPR